MPQDCKIIDALPTHDKDFLGEKFEKKSWMPNEIKIRVSSGLLLPVWPDIEIKRSLNISESGPKKYHTTGFI